jgi:hypothetical protein
MEKMETKGLKREELEAQEFGLLPDRVEMRRRRRRGASGSPIPTLPKLSSLGAATRLVSMSFTSLNELNL